MKIIRTLYGEFSDSEVDFLISLGIKIKRNFCNRIYIDDEEKYSLVLNKLSKTLERSSPFSYKLALLNLNRIYTYSKEEIQQSNYCYFHIPIGGGYPQPEEKFMEITYDKTRCCKCGIPLIQTNNFRINKISNRPLWGFTAWIYDVIFVHEDFYKQIFEPLGIKCRPVEKVSGKIREGVVQLMFPITDETLNLPYHYVETCPICGSKKYRPWGHMPFYPEHKHPLPNMFLTQEMFGSGWEFSRDVIISSKLAMKLLELKAIKMDSLIPCRKDFEEYLKNNPDLIPYRR